MIEPDDFGFYEKINVPPPTFCPECRMIRRHSWKDSISIYSRKCELCGKSVVSIYAPDSDIVIYCNKCWWSDKWDPKSYGVDYDFSRPFFSQFRELLSKVPHMSVVNDDGIASLNCEYAHDWWFSKNCYMCFGGWFVENIMYSFNIIAGKNMMDCLDIMTDMEWAYECANAGRSLNLKYSTQCKACIDSQFLLDCRDCSNCFMCTGLRSKKYFFKNKQYSKEEYEKILESYKLDTFSGVEKAKKEFEDFVLKQPRRYSDIFNSTPNCTGNNIFRCKNVKNSFGARKSENSRYLDWNVDTKDSYDLTTSGILSESYEGYVVDHSQMNRFGIFSVKSQDIQYTQHCHNCKHVFGCVGLRNANHCIFNKQYTKEKYEKLVPRIIKQMNEIPYIDKIGNVYKYGEFFPTELSPFGYNETFAFEYFPLEKKEAIAKGYNWQDNTQLTTGKETLKADSIPDSIDNINESILSEILACIECGRNYKIVQNELNFYKKMSIPIPRKCFYCRHKARLAWRNPFRLWHRICMCNKENHFHGGGKCEVEFETPYAPERQLIVYCEKCYQAEMY